MTGSTIQRSVPFVLAAASVAALGLADTSFTGLGSLLPGNYIPGNYAYLSEPRDVNFDGTVVVGMAATNSYESNNYFGRRFRWTAAGGVEAIPRPSFLSQEPTLAGVTDDGNTTVSTAVGPSTGPDPFSSRMLRETVGQEPRTVLFIPGGGTGNPANSSFGQAISGDGSVLAGSARAASSAQRAAVWTSAATSPVGAFAADAFAPPGAGLDCRPRSEVRGVSRNGQFAVGSEEQTYSIGGTCFEIRRAVRWPVSGGAALVLEPGSPIASVAMAASSDGSVVVGTRSYTIDFDYGHMVSEMFRWTAQTGMVSLGNAPLGGVASDRGVATDVSADGKVVVGYVGYEAVVWDEAHGLRTVKRAIEDAGGTIGDWSRLYQATSVSGNGRVIVGMGENSHYQLEAWRAVLPATCVADFNGVGGVTVQDVFDYLVAYFANLPSADVNGRDGVTVQDIFDYLVSYFAGCA